METARSARSASDLASSCCAWLRDCSSLTACVRNDRGVRTRRMAACRGGAKRAEIRSKGRRATEDPTARRSTEEQSSMLSTQRPKPRAHAGTPLPAPLIVATQLRRDACTGGDGKEHV
eukprot:6184009-Pleurochrysis_carterae.AAC.8